MKKVLMLIALLVAVGMSVHGQQKRITGTVKDFTDNMPLVGVTVLVKGTTQGTTTDIDGRYELNVSPGSTLVFRFVGMTTEEVLIRDQQIVDILLKPDAATLQQVVITAMGIRRDERTLTYNVQSVGSDELTASRQENLVNALQGRVSGVQITSSGGAPGAASEIILRGATSVDGDNQPLFIIDGVPISNASVRGTTNRAADINPNDIESISVLKGAAAAALYGIDAANGAIIITTKKGKEGTVSVGLSASTTASQVGKLHGLQQSFTTGVAGIYNPRTFSHYGPLFRRSDDVYDNLNEFFQTGVTSKFDANISGGSNNLTYYLTMSNLMDKGIVPNTDFGRTTAMLTGSAKISEKLSITTTANVIKTNNTYGIVSGSGGWMMNVYRWPRWDNMQDIYKLDGTERDVWIPVSGDLSEVPDNPLWSAFHNVRNDKVDRTIASVNVNYKVNDWLSMNYVVGRDFFFQHLKAVREWGSSGSAFQGAISEFNRESEKLNSTLLLTADKEVIPKLNVTLLAGQNVQSDFARNSFMDGEGFKNPPLHSINNIEDVRTSQSTYRRRLIGVFGGLTVDYNRFVVLGFTGRNDWSSTLPLENRSFFYPSYSIAVIPSSLYEDSPFYNILTFSKIRASYAKVGKDAPAHRLTPILEPFYGINGGWRNGRWAGNPILKPEITSELELGIDLRFFNGFINLDFTYYNRTSDNQIFEPRVTPVIGSVFQTINSGSIQNKGMEALLSVRLINKKDFGWETSFNAFGNRSKLLELFGDMVELPVTYGQVSSQFKATSWLGQPLFSIEGTDYLRNKEGKVIVDANGYPKIDNTRRFIGNREPELYYGLNNNFRYKNFEFSFLWDGAYGAQLMNATSQFLISTGNHELMDKYRMREFIFDGVVEVEEGVFVENTTPIILDREFFQNYYNLVGTNFVEKAYWIRLRNINVTYRLPGNLAKSLRMKEADLNLNLQNIYLITNYSGGDPEVNNAGPGGGGSGAGTMGVDYFQVPHRKAVTMGLNLKF